MTMLPLDHDAAVDKVISGPARSRWRITIKGPSLGADYVSDSRDETILGALGYALHDFSMRTNRNLVTEISEVRIVALRREP